MIKTDVKNYAKIFVMKYTQVYKFLFEIKE